MIHVKALRPCPPSVSSAAVCRLNKQTAPLGTAIIQGFGKMQLCNICYSDRHYTAVSRGRVQSNTPGAAGRHRASWHEPSPIDSLGRRGSWWVGGRYAMTAATSRAAAAKSNSGQCVSCVVLRQQVNKKSKYAHSKGELGGCCCRRRRYDAYLLSNRSQLTLALSPYKPLPPISSLFLFLVT